MLIIIIVSNVLLRYVFKSNSIKLEELQWHLYGVIVLIGLSYAQLEGAHSRIDLFHHNFSNPTKIIIEIVGHIVLLFPFLTVLFLHSLELTTDAYVHLQGSEAPSGLPYRWIIKSFIPSSLILLFLASVSRVLQDLQHLMISYEYK